MPNPSAHIRKAAVLIRSLDAETAASLLAQLSPEEADAVRGALRGLGPLDPDEQQDVLAEFRHTAPLVKEPSSAGVTLELASESSEEAADPTPSLPNNTAFNGKRFKFLEETPVGALVPYLAREHSQTIAVVLSYLPPSRAAAVLAGLPAAVQAETIERLDTLGETDPDSLNVVERELGTWVAQRAKGRPGRARRGEALMSILAAADTAARDGIIISLKTQKASLAKRLAPLLPRRGHPENNLSQADNLRKARANSIASARDYPGEQCRRSPSSPGPDRQPVAPSSRRLSTSCTIEDLVRLSKVELASVLRQVDASVLVLAMTGASEEVLSRVCIEMPRRAAKALRRQLGCLGPTRLSDVAAAQSIVAAAMWEASPTVIIPGKPN